MTTKKSNSQNVKRGINYEKSKSKDHGAKHVGGPGNHDYERGAVKGEVKCRKSPVTKPELQKYAKKGIREIESKSGFTGPALDYRDKHQKDMTLFHRGKKL